MINSQGRNSISRSLLSSEKNHLLVSPIISGDISQVKNRLLNVSPLHEGKQRKHHFLYRVSRFPDALTLVAMSILFHFCNLIYKSENRRRWWEKEENDGRCRSPVNFFGKWICFERVTSLRVHRNPGDVRNVFGECSLSIYDFDRFVLLAFNPPLDAHCCEETTV